MPLYKNMCPDGASKLTSQHFFLLKEIFIVTSHSHNFPTKEITQYVKQFLAANSTKSYYIKSKKTHPNKSTYHLSFVLIWGLSLSLPRDWSRTINIFCLVLLSLQMKWLFWRTECKIGANLDLRRFFWNLAIFQLFS